MRKYYIEIITYRTLDDTLPICVIRRPAATVYDAMGAIHNLLIGMFNKDDHPLGPDGWKCGTVDAWHINNAPLWENDCGEFVQIAWVTYQNSEAVPVSVPFTKVVGGVNVKS